MSRDIHDVLENVISGAAIVFLGAGFSWGAKIPDPNNKDCEIDVPSSDKAAKILADSVGILDDIGAASLSDVAEFVTDEFDSDVDYSNHLTSFFLKYFTHCKPTPTHKAIIDLPWRSVFTTNYDDLVERSASEKSFAFYSPNSSNLDIPPGKTPVYHVHGRAADLMNPSTLDGFVLTETNYLELDKHNKDVYNRLFGDIHAASEVVFIGYSMRDLEIASRLFSIKSVSRKVSIIIKPDTPRMESKRLDKFGTVYQIGLEGFATAAKELLTNKSNECTPNLKCLTPIKMNTELKDVTAEDVNELILTGDFNMSVYMSSLAKKEMNGKDESDIYSVDRLSSVEEVLKDIQSGKSRVFLIDADVGNGKTVFLNQLAGHASTRLGMDVYKIATQLQEVYDDIISVVSNGRRSIFIIDGYARHRKLISFITPRLGEKCVLVVSDPARNDEFAGDAAFAEFNEKAKLVSLNKLTTQEIRDWNDYLERWGLWGSKIQLGTDQRDQFIRKDCSAENRSLIISLFRNSNLSIKIDSLVTSFISNNEDYEQGLIAILIRALCHQHVEWSHVVSWLNLNEREIEKRVKSSGFRKLTEDARRWHEVTSPELASYIFNNYNLNDEVKINTYCTIVTETASLSTDSRNGQDSRENLKELMRYRFLTRVFSEGDRQGALINTVYQRLSKNRTIREKELFWLQWAMARLDLNDTERAETYLKFAEGLATKYGKNHSMIQIQDQYARLYFKKSAKSGTKIEPKEISQAITITRTSIKKGPDSLIYPLRTAILIDELLNERTDDLPPDLVTDLLDLVREMISLAREENVSRASKGEMRDIMKALQDSLIVLQNA